MTTTDKCVTAVVLWTLIACLLCVITSEAATCSIAEGTGTRRNLIGTVIVNFGSAVVSTYTSNELVATFSVNVSSRGRPLFATSAVASGTSVNLTLSTADADFEAQTGFNVSVTFTPLSDVSRSLTVGGTPLTAGRLCSYSTDLIGPVFMAAHAMAALAPTNVVLFFSEPVQKCGGGNPLVAAFTLSGFSTADTSLTAYGTAPSSVWYFSSSTVQDSSSCLITMSAGAVCDASGNLGLASSANAILVNLERRFFSGGGTASFKYYDLNGNGLIDAALLITSFAVNITSFPVSPVPVTIGGVAVSNPVLALEEVTIGNAILITFTDTALTGTIASIDNTPTTLYGPSISCSPGIGSTRVFNDFIPARLLSAVGNIGSNQVTLTMSEAHTTTLSSSQFAIASTYGLAITGSTGTPTTTQIILTLNASITDVNAFGNSGNVNPIRFYPVLQAYGSATDGFPQWLAATASADVTSAVILRTTANSPWDTLRLTFARAINQSSVAISNVAFSSPVGSIYNVTMASAISSTVVDYYVGLNCSSTLTPCLSTAMDFTYSLSGVNDSTNTSIGSMSGAVAVDQAAPTFVGVAAAVGSNRMKIQLSETISYAQSFFGAFPATIGASGLKGLLTSATANSNSYTVTLYRSLTAADLDGLLGSTVNVTLVDAAGNTGTDTLVPGVFAARVAAFDGDGDGFVDRIRLTTTLNHYPITSSAGFLLSPYAALGTVTRVSGSISDFAVIDGPGTNESLTLEYIGGSAGAKLQLQSPDTRTGFEMLPIVIAIPSNSTDSETPSPSPAPPTTTIVSGDSDFSDLPGWQQGLLIGSAFAGVLLGIVLAKWCMSSSYGVKNAKTGKRHKVTWDRPSSGTRSSDEYGDYGPEDLGMEASDRSYFDE